MSKLTLEQIDEYFKVHLPYRTRILKAHKSLTDRGPYNGDQAILQACFEASLITGRMYLNVLGISKNGKGELIKTNFKADDVTAEDLGGTLVDTNSLSQNDKDDFVNFLIMSNKGAAHLTTPRKHEWDKTHFVIDKIIALLQRHIYDKTNRTM
jgi:hypothetical protein